LPIPDKDGAQGYCKLEKELENLKDDLLTWTDSLEELSEIESAFATDGKIKLQGKTILDVGTDCVKPLYIALKFKPDKIIGIGEVILQMVHTVTFQQYALPFHFG